MYGTIDIKVNAKNINLPLQTVFSSVNSPIHIRLINIPKPIGKSKITEVFVKCAYPDNSTHIEKCSIVSGCYFTTIPACGTSGKSVKGIQVIANGTDQDGNEINGYCLGIGDIVVIDRDGSYYDSGTVHYLHLLSAESAEPQQGDIYHDGSTFKIYDGSEWKPTGNSVIDLSAYAKKQWVEDKHYTTSSYVDSAVSSKADISSLTGYATKQWVEDKDYATSSYVDSQLSSKADRRTVFVEDSEDDCRIQIGNNAEASGEPAGGGRKQSIAIGLNAKATGMTSIAIGSGGSDEETDETRGAKAFGDDSIAIGYNTACAGQSVAIGDRSAVSGIHSVALGAYVSTDIATNAVAIGKSATLSSNYAVGVGSNSNPNGEYAIAVGYQSTAKQNAIGIGYQSSPSDNGVAIGRITTGGSNAIGIGYIAKANGSGSVAIGYNANTELDKGIAIGNNCQAKAKYAIAIGDTAKASTNLKAISIGSSSNAEGQESVAIGANTSTPKTGSVAIGTGSKGNGRTSIAIGYNAIATADNCAQIGTGQNSTAETIKFMDKTLATEEYVDKAVSSVQPSSLSDYATIEYTNEMLSSKADISSLTGYATSDYVDSAVSSKRDILDFSVPFEIDIPAGSQYTDKTKFVLYPPAYEDELWTLGYEPEGTIAEGPSGAKPQFPMLFDGYDGLTYVVKSDSGMIAKIADVQYEIRDCYKIPDGGIPLEDLEWAIGDKIKNAVAANEKYLYKQYAWKKGDFAFRYRYSNDWIIDYYVAKHDIPAGTEFSLNDWKKLESLSDYFSDANTALVNTIDGTVSSDISSYISSAVSSVVSSVVSSMVDSQLSTKADKATTLSGYGITDAYTKREIDWNKFVSARGGTYPLSGIIKLDTQNSAWKSFDVDTIQMYNHQIHTFDWDCYCTHTQKLPDYLAGGDWNTAEDKFVLSSEVSSSIESAVRYQIASSNVMLDRSINVLAISVDTAIQLPEIQTSQLFTKDLILDLSNTSLSSVYLSLTGLDNNFKVITRDGDKLNEMTEIKGEEHSIFTFTRTGNVENLPCWLISKMVVKTFVAGE